MIFRILFAAGIMLRLKYLGVNLTGISVVAWLLVVYGLDRWKAHRDWKSDPNRPYVDENGVVRYER